MYLPSHAFVIGPAVAREDGRFAMSAVHLDRKGIDGSPRAVATDGRVLAIATWTEPDQETLPDSLRNGTSQDPEFLPASLLKDGLRLAKAWPRVPWVRAERAEQTVSLVSHEGTVGTTCTTDGEFPNFDAVIPKGDPTFRVSMSASRLADMLKLLGAAMKLLGTAHKGDPVEFRFFGPATPVELRIPGHSDQQTVRAWIMPYMTDVAEPETAGRP